MSLYAWFKSAGPSGFGYASTAEEVTDGVDLSGKTVLITGINSGLGAETARVLHMRGARILGAARTLAKARDALASLGKDAVPLACELSEPASVRACVETASAHGPIDVLLCNAGIMALPELIPGSLPERTGPRSANAARRSVLSRPRSDRRGRRRRRARR